MLQIENKTYYPTPNQLCLMPQGKLQSYSTINKNTFKKYWCHFTANIGEKNLFDFFPTPYILDIKNTEHIIGLFHKLIQHFHSEQLTAAIETKAVMLEIIAYFLKHTLEETELPTLSDSIIKLNEITNYMEKMLPEDIQVQDLAEKVNFHPNYFIKFFKKHLGISPMQYVLQMRISKVRTLLTSTSLTVTEIAEATGFSNVYHLSSTFKKHTGFSPTEYRNLSNR